ncbi:HC-toxin synthetase [Cordyceps javanica]|uniref:HC-toxin synthetase n=1 Tax=Cordyceps javanica TaxID=43265 RepID=A0A545V687_9HYPO|nr:HC-toxin synthetase [Cordyceps javanica]TQW08451.1 HC-toxin synthetase [Cordyceps javanica]
MSISVLAHPAIPLDRYWKDTLDEPSTQNSGRDTIITRLRELWAEILGQSASDFTDQDVFFDVGGDSISALDLAVASQRQGIILTVEQIFFNASLEDMAKVATLSQNGIEEIIDLPPEPFDLLSPMFPLEVQTNTLTRLCHVAPDKIENAYPCTSMQESLVVVSEGAENAYVLQLVYEMDKSVQVEDFRLAWEATVCENPVLRTRICHLEQIGYVQAVLQDEIEWRTATGLSRFLEGDAGLPMNLGDRFFRYALVADGARRYFVWTVHHALCDGASILEILEEVSQRFRNERPRQRYNFDRFVRATVPSASHDAQEFWRKTLADTPASIYPALPSPDFHATPSSVLRRPLNIPESSVLGSTKALLLRSAWAVLISHYTGAEDVSFGAIVSGRSSSLMPEIERVTGPTIGLLPIVLRVDREQSVVSFLARVRDQAAEMMPFEQTGIINIRKYSSEQSTACDFQSLFVAHSSEPSQAAAPALKALGLKDVPGLGKVEEHPYPLIVSVFLSSGTEAQLKIQYDERVISAQYARNLGNQFQAVVHQLVSATSETLLGSISPLNKEDIAQIREWNKFTPPPEETCFHHLFRRQVCRTPHAEAVCSLEESLTYAEVDNISSSLSVRLIKLGVNPETFVAVCFEKSIWTVVAMLAVFKAGGAYVPIDPTHPRGRILEVVEATQIKVAIASPLTKGALEGICEVLISIENLPLSHLPDALETLSSRVRPTNSAYLLFTSGSTGKPKGLLVSHSALCTSILHHGTAFGASRDWRTVQFSAHTFDLSVAEFFTTLAFGGCICVPSDHDRMNNLAATIRSLNVNTALLTPTAANLLMPEEVPNLKRIVLAGEPVTKETIRRWASHVSLTNAYGPAETTIYCAGNVGISIDANPAAIGRNIGATMWIANVNDHNQLCAIGCVGEIVISGALLAKGYYAAPEITEASFVAAPEWLRMIQPCGTYDRIYKSGDLARHNPDGSFHIIGRKDTQVKLRGYRIELGEIENRIMEQGAVTMALAILPQLGPCSRQIVAIVSFDRLQLGHKNGPEVIVASERERKDAHGSLEKLKAHLAFTLPDYMIPSIWVVLNRVPLLSAGKINRNAIRSWIQSMDMGMYSQLTDGISSVDESDFVSASSLNSLRLIWSQVLNVPLERIGKKSSFFSLGGDSISAIQVVSKARAIGFSITVREILRSKTLGTLVTLIRNEISNEPNIFEKLQVPYRTDEAFRLSPIQRLFRASNGDSTSVARFNQALMLRLRRPFPESIVQEAFSAAVERHEMLRTRFPREHDWTRQVTTSHGEGHYRFKSHGHLAEEQIAQVVTESHDSICISTGPAFSVDLFYVAKETLLFLSAHHLVIDLVSWRILLQDVEDYIETGSFKTSVGTSFYQWTRFLESKFASDDLNPDGPENRHEDDLDYMGFQAFHNTRAEVQVARWVLDRAATRDLLNLSVTRASAEPVEVIMAAVASSFWEVFRRPCPTLFVEGHGREPLDSGIDLSNTVGWFTVLYPITSFPTENAWLEQYIHHVRKGRQVHPDNGLEYFARSLLTEGNDLSHLQTKPIQFNFQGTYHQFESDDSVFGLVDYPNLEDTLIGSSVKRTSVFEIEAAIRDGQLQFSFSFPQHLNNISRVLDWSNHIKSTLHSLGQILREDGGFLLPGSVSSFLSTDDFFAHEEELKSRLGDNPSIVVEDAYPCSPMQQEMLRQQALDPSVFLLSWAMEISTARSEPIDLARLSRSWKNVVQKHTILRTVFLQGQTTRATPLQVVLAAVEPDITISSTLEAYNDWKDAPSYSRNSLLPHRLLINRIGEKVIAHLEISHLAIDGWSLGLIKTDLLAGYDADDIDVEMNDAPYRRFISAHSQAHIRADEEYWASALHNYRPSLITTPTSRTQPSVQFPSAKTIISLPTLDARSFAAIGSQHGITLASIFNAAWAQTLRIYTQHPDVVFGYVVSGRDLDIPGVFDIVGPLVNVLAHHLRDVPASGTFEELIILAQKIQEQRMSDGQFTFCNIQEVIEKQLGVSQLFNSTVNFQRRPTAMEKAGLKVQDMERSKDPWHFDVLVRLVVDNDDRIQPQVEFDPAVLDGDRMQAVADDFWERLQISVS